MSVAQMREALRQQYGRNRTWVEKVNQMPDKQVMAIYYRMLRAGTFKN